MHAIVWEFKVATTNRSAFEKAYGPNGDWVMLFRSSAGYRGTQLLRDEAEPSRYLTIDRWESRADFEVMKATFATEYDRLDRLFENLTVSETKIGDFATD
ncbi:antibiotic biosynthesis monooxygenase family protein [Microvirga flavescens]|uniref:antibiotic biosynthesis monooxygenase family protein n=1 Tax=Microvirga flavescens TaxID=2249811 RepID=UPI000DDA8FE4|nr:antibiotic biosynthesis monooxygenase [Microvirga flavescens]